LITYRGEHRRENLYKKLGVVKKREGKGGGVRDVILANEGNLNKSEEKGFERRQRALRMHKKKITITNKKLGSSNQGLAGVWLYGLNLNQTNGGSPKTLGLPWAPVEEIEIGKSRTVLGGEKRNRCGRYEKVKKR